MGLGGGLFILDALVDKKNLTAKIVETGTEKYFDDAKQEWLPIPTLSREHMNEIVTPVEAGKGIMQNVEVNTLKHTIVGYDCAPC